ncbi:hypothetical protein KD050_07705 [Psychrobacillus sp. INOP01]|uniref:hypothetical protein n=1 Tax=Psychrobacillus sp. INOP01 TaxID=2829187 RepID=UPI001BAB8925|nr:hypothetical protein [Psychrobacillus sp. INOP01]QUG43107.1 hypothetical protein KD050_07705 [Psychrobacillus sp. INOP01]
MFLTQTALTMKLFATSARLIETAIQKTKVGEAMTVFLLIMLFISLTIIVFISICGLRAKTSENMILFQSLLVFFLYNFLLIVIPLFYKLFPEPEIDNTSYLFTLLFPGVSSHYAGFIFIVIFPTLLGILLSMTVLGIKGLIQWKTKKDKLLLAVSIVSTLSFISLPFTIILYPLITIYIVCLKMVRKQNEKSNPI